MGGWKDAGIPSGLLAHLLSESVVDPDKRAIECPVVAVGAVTL